MPIQKRTEVLFRWRPMLLERMDEIATLVSTELGKNLDEARGEVVKIIEAVEVAVAAPMLMKGESLMNVATGHDTVSYREPLGVFAGIAPFNFPAMIPFGWMIPLCIATGNTFVLKAANLVPLTSHPAARTALRGRPAQGRRQPGDLPSRRRPRSCSRTRPSAASPSSAPRRSASTSTPSPPPTASASRRRRRPRTTASCSRDASLERAARGIINSTFGCAGMRCMALPVCVVENAVADEFIAYMKKFAKERVVGSAYDPKTELGPVVSAEHQASVRRWIDKGVDEGAELVLDGRDLVVPGYEKGHFVGPTIFDHVTPEMSCGWDEIFGPVLSIKRVDDFEEGLTIMNDSRFANGSCIFTESGYYSREFARRTHAGMVGINVGIPVPVSFFPFAGHKDSFFGDIHVLGKDGIHFFTETKCVTTRWFTEADKKQKKVSTWEGTVNR